MKKLSLAVIGLALIAPFGAARAQIPAATENFSCEFNPAFGNPPVIVPGTPGCSVTGVQLSVSTEPSVSLQANVNADMELGSSMAQGTLTFYFEVLGGTQFQQVPILVTTDLNTTSSGLAGGNASVTITPQPQDPGFDVVGKAVCSNITASACAGQSASFSGTLDAVAFDGVAGKLAMFISAGGGNNDVELSGVATASADPGVEIDPTYLLDHPGLTLELSAGIGNGLPAGPQSVPEPTSFALLVTGLAGLAGLGHARRRNRT